MTGVVSVVYVNIFPGALLNKHCGHPERTHLFTNKLDTETVTTNCYCTNKTYNMARRKINAQLGKTSKRPTTQSERAIKRRRVGKSTTLVLLKMLGKR